MMFVYLVQHSYENNGCEETKIIGIYSSRSKAKEAVEKYKQIKGFKDYPDDFYIASYEVDKDHWCEGFIKQDEAFRFHKNKK